MCLLRRRRLLGLRPVLLRWWRHGWVGPRRVIIKLRSSLAARKGPGSIAARSTTHAVSTAASGRLLPSATNAAAAAAAAVCTCAVGSARIARAMNGRRRTHAATTAVATCTAVVTNTAATSIAARAAAAVGSQAAPLHSVRQRMLVLLLLCLLLLSVLLLSVLLQVRRWLLLWRQQLLPTGHLRLRLSLHCCG